MNHLDTHALQQLDAAHHLHPFNDNAALAKNGTRILTKGEGVMSGTRKATRCSTPSPACGA